MVTFSKKTFCCLSKKILRSIACLCMSFQMLKASLGAYAASLCENWWGTYVYTPLLHSSKRKKTKNVQISSIYL